MNNFAKSILKKILPAEVRSKVKKSRRRFINRTIKRNSSKTTLGDVKKMLKNDFGIVRGDNLIVSSSFGNLNADFSPQELAALLQETVGKEGNIVMPFYPPGNSYEWAESGQIFDMRTTKSSMGVLTQVFSEMNEVYKSKHPVKAVVAWGKNAEEIIAGHETSKTPFYWDSPYGWLLKNPSKSLGLGLKNIPIFHSFEDILHNDSLYQEQKTLKVKDGEGNITACNVLVHDPVKLSELYDAGDYVKVLGCPSYTRQNFGYSFCYVIDNQELFKKCEEEFAYGNFRYKNNRTVK